MSRHQVFSIFCVVLLIASAAQGQNRSSRETATALVSAQQQAAPTDRPPASMTAESYVEGARRSGRFMDLTLKDAIKLALINNLEIAIEDFNEDINEKRYVGVQGFYDPIAVVEGGYSDNTTPTGSVITAGAGVATFQSIRGFWNSHLTQNLPWGASYSVDWLSSRLHSNSQLLTVNPQYSSTLALTFTQPLLRGYVRTQTKRQLSLINLDLKLNQSQFEQKVADIVRKVNDQYWELVFSIRNQSIKRRSMELAWQQYEDNKKRFDIGTLAGIDITAARAEVATREQDTIASAEGISTAQNSLKRLLTADPKSDLWNLSLIPTEEPAFIEFKVNLDEAIRTAIANRPEINQMQIQLARTAVDQQFYRQEGKWKVDLITSYIATGLSGAPLKNGALNPDSPLFGALGPLYSQVFGQDFRSYTASVRVEIPLRNRQNSMQLAQLNLQRLQTVSQVKNVEEQIIVEVRNAAESIETNRKRVEAAKVASQLSVERLDGETRRFQTGLSTTFLVLQYQRDLEEAQLRELRALIDYREAITALQKATFTILSASDIQTAKQGNANNTNPQEPKSKN
ncbi:MAG TPA: TolC family protein [Acidobacteriota bacterium]